MQLRSDVPLAQRTTLRLGGAAARLLEASSEADVVAAVREVDASGEPLLVLGGGSNLVVADEGFPGTVVQVLTRGFRTEPSAAAGHVRLTVAAGEPWDLLVEQTVREGLAGLECLSGVPGATGASPVQNIGAYGQEVADSLVDVRVLDRQDGDIRVMPAPQCAFGYRTSVFKRSDRFVVLAVTFELARSDMSCPVRYPELARALGIEVAAAAPLGAVREAVLAVRRGKGMVLDEADTDTWSAGSFFTNPIVAEHVAAALPGDAPRYPQPDGTVKLSAAWLLERAGVRRGQQVGRVRVSSKHVLALTNLGGATTAELLELAREVRGAVAARFGIELTPEPSLVGCRL